MFGIFFDAFTVEFDSNWTVSDFVEQSTTSAPSMAPVRSGKEHDWTLYYEKKSRAKIGKVLNKNDYMKELQPVGTFRNTEVSRKREKAKR